MECRRTGGTNRAANQGTEAGENRTNGRRETPIEGPMRGRDGRKSVLKGEIRVEVGKTGMKEEEKRRK